jgi:hypothetical protein
MRDSTPDLTLLPSLLYLDCRTKYDAQNILLSSVSALHCMIACVMDMFKPDLDENGMSFRVVGH